MATESGEDYTDGPLSTDNCGSCHSGGAYGTEAFFELRDLSGSIVTEYLPGASYTLTFRVTASSGAPDGFGFQGVLLTSENDQAGTIEPPLTTSSTVTSLGSVQYAESNSSSATGIFEYPWIAPDASTGTVGVYFAGLAVNGSGTSGDDPTAGLVVEIPESALSPVPSIGPAGVTLLTALLGAAAIRQLRS